MIKLEATELELSVICMALMRLHADGEITGAHIKKYPPLHKYATLEAGTETRREIASLLQRLRYELDSALARRDGRGA
jgi:hypothetical protein